MSLLGLPWKKTFRRIVYNLKQKYQHEIYFEPKEVFKFSSDIVKKCRVSTDMALGGKTTAQLLMSPSERTAIFSGIYSKDIDDNSSLVRSGFGSINYKFNKGFNLRPYDFFDVRLRGDGRTYVLNLRLEHMADGEEDVWQALLRTKPGEWMDSRIEFRDLILSFKGRAVAEASLYRVPVRNMISLGVSFSVSDEDPNEGSFEIEMESFIAGSYRLKGEVAYMKVHDDFSQLTPKNEGLYDFPRRVPPPISSLDAPRPKE
mmetsp:Transcript_608/g.759  ORF Transcript_608/g.759 Transcript_608/m.759 type:complete len:259 (-) Transcript_608:156-932(-)|eukprot:CAMPEP_0175044690 /NCGR_PEP_ID=MMETSP0052_2-20121109/3964_1 /TAXON_ID=51329 ORGANISM="Polytomella parva, Strain SAG 63-3" /NCGR_SAMPLE_ID=MMETSP0052_2 /ASSEMBLY_ACC=CAM_ASM_000194 /LENGTH=258 /DNA_ID=CAMNT_0016308051 /DNA_START=142 /DNA_END=918 /DNA_ORIENTATION=+